MSDTPNFIIPIYNKVEKKDFPTVYENIWKNNASNTSKPHYDLYKYVLLYSNDHSTPDIPKLEPIQRKLKGSCLQLFRYMKAEHFMNDITNNQLTFISPELWKDPFEKIHFQEKGINIGNKHYNLACICFTYDKIEGEESAWLRCGFDNIKDYVRVGFDFNKLCDELENHNEFKFYFSIADYSQSRRQIIKAGKEGPITKIESIEDYITLMSLKRKAFSYENEIRLFIVWEKPLGDIFPLTKLDLKNTITEVTLPPVLPHESKEDNSSQKQSDENIEKDLSKIKLENIFTDVKINRCHLYDIK